MLWTLYFRDILSRLREFRFMEVVELALGHCPDWHMLLMPGPQRALVSSSYHGIGIGLSAQQCQVKSHASVTTRPLLELADSKGSLLQCGFREQSQGHQQPGCGSLWGGQQAHDPRWQRAEVSVLSWSPVIFQVAGGSQKCPWLSSGCPSPRGRHNVILAVPPEAAICHDTDGSVFKSWLHYVR